MNNLVSVIIPTYNRVQVLSQAIDSVLKQTYQEWELLIIDDGSTDNTCILVMSYLQKDKRFKYFLNTNRKGVAGARNCGISHAKGSFIAFLDSDDEWAPFHLEKSMAALKKYNVLVCYSLWTEKSANIVFDLSDPHQSEWFHDKLNQAIMILAPQKSSEHILFGKNFFEYSIQNFFYCFHINTLVVHRDAIKKSGTFNPKLLCSEDSEFSRRLIHNHSFCLLLNSHFIYHWGNDDSLYGFFHRGKMSLTTFKDNPHLLKKIYFFNKYNIKMWENIKTLIWSSTQITNKKCLIDSIDNLIFEKLQTLIALTKQYKRTVSLYYCMISFLYKPDFKKNILLLLHLICPRLFKDPNSSMNYCFYRI